MTTPAASTAASARALRIRQAAVISLLFGGYASLYFCRADLSVATPLLAKELAGRGVSYDDALVRIGAITSLGILAYALGNPFIGGLGDYWGGRVNFLVGLAGATLFTVLFAFSGALPLFTLTWFLNRLPQSGAWAGLAQSSSRWFDYSSHGAIIGVLSLSYLLGDAGRARMDGAADRTWIRLAEPVRARRGGFRCDAHRQFRLAARVAGRGRPWRNDREPAQCVRELDGATDDRQRALRPLMRVRHS